MSNCGCNACSVVDKDAIFLEQVVKRRGMEWTVEALAAVADGMSMAAFDKAHKTKGDVTVVLDSVSRWDRWATALVAATKVK